MSTGLDWSLLVVMRFLEDFAAVYKNTKEPSLLDVQKAVFDHFADLRKNAKNAMDLSPEPLPNTMRTQIKKSCPCFLDPGCDISCEDLLRYRDLLASVAVNGALGKRKTSDQLSELHVLHGRVTKAQLNVQKELLNCVPCIHGNLSPQCESLVFEFLSMLYEDYLSRSTTNEYKLFKSINPARSNTSSFVLHGSQTVATYKLLIPEAGKNRLSYSNNISTMNFKTLKATDLPECVRRQPGDPGHSLILLSELVLVLLFTQAHLNAIYIPFTVSERHGDHRKCHKELKFSQPLWFNPPDPRMRARLFYDMAAQFHLFEKRISTPVESGISTPLDSLTTGLRVDPLSDPNSSSTNTPSPSSKSIRTRAKNTGDVQTTGTSIRPPNSSAVKPPISQSRKLNNKNSQSNSGHQDSLHLTSASPIRRSTRLAAINPTKSPKSVEDHRPLGLADIGGEDEAEVGDLSIDITTDPEDKESPGDTTDLSSLRTQILTTCAVISRVATRTRSHSVEISENSCPNSPSVDAPASPSETTDTDLNVGEPNHITRSLTTPLEIPLEPVQNDTLMSARTSLSRCPSSKRGADDVLSEQSDVTPSVPGSIATVEINGTTVQVQYTNTAWAVGESCLACSGSSNEEVGQCPMWPSCDSLKSRWAQNESKLGKFQPVYLQIKPEYLGDWGCEVLSPFELAQAWLGSVLRGKSDIVRVRVCADSGELVWLEYQSYDELLLSHPDLKPEVHAGATSALFDELLSLSAGSYLLSQSDGSSYEVYETVQIKENHNSHSNTSEPNGQKVSLSDGYDHLKNLATSVINLSTALDSTQNTDTKADEDKPANLWFCTPRARLDLDLPAGLDISKGGLSGRALRLPGLPANRLHALSPGKCSSLPNNSSKTSLPNQTKRPKLNSSKSPRHSATAKLASKRTAKRRNRKKTEQSA